MSALLNTLLDVVKNEFMAEPPHLETISTVHDADIQFLNEECNKESEFDPHNKRKHMVKRLLNDEAPINIIKCEFGQIFAVYEEPGQSDDIPWELWARILRLYSKPGDKPFKVFLLANTHLREFPPGKEPISPHNINGGYTYRCDRETILIYRAEDATRVLIHELMHSCCADKPENGLDVMEAETEAWAELVYIALLSQGKPFIFNDLLKKQSEWMRKQNQEVRKHMKRPDSREFPWRYTIGKEDVWRRWGILSTMDLKPVVSLNNSLRLTYPPNEVLKKRFQVRKQSTIL